MTPTEQATIWGQLAIALVTVLGFVVKELSDRRGRARLAHELAAKEAIAEIDRKRHADEIEARVEGARNHLEGKIDENTAMTATAAQQSREAATVANNFNTKLERVTARFDAVREQQIAAQNVSAERASVQIERQAGQIERIDQTTSESKDILEDLADTGRVGSK